jgi:hypothetical protein
MADLLFSDKERVTPPEYITNPELSPACFVLRRRVYRLYREDGRQSRRACRAWRESCGSRASTDYPLGVARKIPFKAHGATELIIGLALPALPHVLGFAEHRAARNFCFGLAGLTFVVAALTDWNAES